jgi:DNA-binding CsgD family transcriptional regulator
MTAATISRYRRHVSSVWLLGYGLWWAVYYSGAIHGSLWVTLPQEEPFSGRAQLLLLSVPFGVMLVLLLLARRWLAPLHERRGLLLGFAVATGISLALTSFGEMPFAGFAGGMAATWLPQATAALMAVAWGELYGAAGARRACLGLCGSLLVGLGLAGVVRATGDVAPLSGAVFLAFCPWLSMAALLRAWKTVPLPPFDRVVQRGPFRMPSTVALAMFTSFFTVGFMVSLTTPRAHLGSNSWLGSAIAVAAIALLMLWQTRSRRDFAVRGVAWPVILYLAAAFVLLPIASYGFSRDAALPGSALLSVLWVTTSASIVFRAPAPAVAVMSWNQLLSLAGVALGGIASSALLTGAVLSDPQLAVIAVGVVSLLVLGSYPALRRSAVETCWGLLPKRQSGASRSPEDYVAERCAQVAETYGLTPREREVLVLLARGMRADEIAGSFTVSEATVRTHIKRIHEKLDVHSQPQLMRMIVFDGPAEASAEPGAGAPLS